MLTQVFPRLRPRIDWSSLLSFLLVGVVVGGMLYTLTEVLRGFKLDFIWPVALIAVVWGTAFGSLQPRRWLVVTLSLLAGLLLLFVMVGRLGDEIVALGNEAALYVQTLFEEDVEPTLEPLRAVILQIGESFGLMITLLLRWFQNLPKPGYDPISTYLVWGLAVWISGVWASWFLLRHRPLFGAMPAILLAGFTSSFSGTLANSLLVILGATLALMVLVSLRVEEDGWIRRRVEASLQIRHNALWASLALSAALVLISATISTLDLGDLLDRIREAQASSVTRPGAGDSGTPRPVFASETVEKLGRLTRGGLPREHLIGSGPELSEQVVMRVKVRENEESQAAEVPQAQPIYYFRALTYDVYTGSGWTTVGGKVYSYRAGQSTTSSYSPNQQLIEQEVIYEVPVVLSGVAHTVGEMASANVDYGVAWRVKTGDGKLEDQFAVSIESEGYSAYSLVPLVSTTGLRAAPAVYPDWVTQRYLQLPEDISPRVKELAVKLTLDAETPYDKALAIESYLRSFPYTLDLGAPPASLELADYFLFTLRQGYCDYFATAMVVLARTVGLPARFAMGYLGATYDRETEEYVVTADLAHSWVEIYFPTYGWVTFEPTSGRPPLDRPAQRELPLAPESDVGPPAKPDRLAFLLPWIPSLIGLGLLLIGLAVFAIPYLDELLLRRSDPSVVFARIYARLREFGERLGVPFSVGSTPYEFSRLFSDRLTQLAAEGKTFLASSEEEVAWLVEKCVQAAYSPSPPRLYERSQAIHVWARLRWRLAAVLFLENISRLRQRSWRSVRV